MDRPKGGRPNRGSRGKSEVTGRSADPNWTPRPARPFKPEVGVTNLAAVQHGADSLLVSAEAVEMIEVMQERLPWLMAECDGLVLDTLIRSVVRWRRLDRWIEEHEIEDIKDTVWQQVDREQRHILTAAGKMGMTAVDRAALMKDQSWARALAGRGQGPQLGERGRAIRAQQGRLPAGGDAGDSRSN